MCGVGCGGRRSGGVGWRRTDGRGQALLEMVRAGLLDGEVQGEQDVAGPGWGKFIAASISSGTGIGVDCRLRAKVMEQAEAYLDDVVRFLRDRSGYSQVRAGEAMRRIEREMKALGLANVGIDPVAMSLAGWAAGRRILYDSTSIRWG